MNDGRLSGGGRSQDRTADSYRVKVIRESAQPVVDALLFKDRGAAPTSTFWPRVARVGVPAALLLGAACAGALPPDATPRQVARAECDRWVGRHSLMQRPERGTEAYRQLVELCVAKHQPWLGVEPAERAAAR